METTGVFTFCLFCVRKALAVLPHLVELLGRFGNGIIGELFALAFIWIFIYFSGPILDRLIAAFIKILHIFE